MQTQYGNGMRDGCAQLGRSVMATLQHHPELCVLQADISNAFGSIGRHAVEAALMSLDSPHRQLVLKWLRTTHWAAVVMPGTEYRLGGTTAGIPQGDPLSAFLFCLTFTSCISKLPMHPDMQTRSGFVLQHWQYVDDLTLATRPANIPALLAVLEEMLQGIGLTLNARKTQLYCMPHMPQPEDAAWKQCWKQYGSDQGLIICGHPWDPAISHRPSIPIGNNSYVEAWLAKRDADQQRVERSILDMAHQASPNDHMKHIAWHLLRLTWNTAHTHLWRSLDSRRTTGLCQAMVQRIPTLLSDLLQLGDLTEKQKQLIYLGARRGGLGIDPPFILAAIHAINAELQLKRHQAPSDEPWSGGFHHATQVLSHYQIEVTHVLQTDLDSLRVEGATKAARFLLRAWQDRQCQALRDNYGWERPHPCFATTT